MSRAWREIDIETLNFLHCLQMLTLVKQFSEANLLSYVLLKSHLKHVHKPVRITVSRLAGEQISLVLKGQNSYLEGHRCRKKYFLQDFTFRKFIKFTIRKVVQKTSEMMFGHSHERLHYFIYYQNCTHGGVFKQALVQAQQTQTNIA